MPRSGRACRLVSALGNGSLGTIFICRRSTSAGSSRSYGGKTRSVAVSPRAAGKPVYTTVDSCISPSSLAATCYGTWGTGRRARTASLEGGRYTVGRSRGNAPSEPQRGAQVFQWVLLTWRSGCDPIRTSGRAGRPSSEPAVDRGHFHWQSRDASLTRLG